jgi:hypothetical protein
MAAPASTLQDVFSGPAAALAVFQGQCFTCTRLLTSSVCRSSRSHAIFTITLEQRKQNMVRPASAPPAVEYTPGGSALPPACANSDSSEGESTEEEDEEDLECAGDDYLIAKVRGKQAVVPTSVWDGLLVGWTATQERSATAAGSVWLTLSGHVFRLALSALNKIPFSSLYVWN